VGLNPNAKKPREGSLAHLVREVDVQPSHPGLSLHGHRFGFLFFKKIKIDVEASPTAFLSKKMLKNHVKKVFYPLPTPGPSREVDTMEISPFAIHSPSIDLALLLPFLMFLYLAMN
jgi:hypothetical protein